MPEVKNVNYYFGSKRNWKLVLYYWIIFIIMPFIAGKIVYGEYGQGGYFGILLLAFMLFVSPFLFLIPFKLSKFGNKAEKMRYLIFGLILPYILIYTSICIYMYVAKPIGIEIL